MNHDADDADKVGRMYSSVRQGVRVRKPFVRQTVVSGAPLDRHAAAPT